MNNEQSRKIDRLIRECFESMKKWDDYSPRAAEGFLNRLETQAEKAEFVRRMKFLVDSIHKMGLDPSKVEIDSIAANQKNVPEFVSHIRLN